LEIWNNHIDANGKAKLGDLKVYHQITTVKKLESKKVKAGFKKAKKY